MTTFERYNVYSEDGYFEPPKGSKYKIGLYGWSFFPKGQGAPPWFVMVFDRHIIASRNAPCLVVKEIREAEDNIGKRFIEIGSGREELQLCVEGLYAEYADYDHDAIFERNSARLRKEADKIIKSRRN